MIERLRAAGGAVAAMARRYLGDPDREMKRDLSREDDETAEGSVVGIRNPWSSSLQSLSDITPQRMRSMLTALRSGGSSAEYLEGAELIEEAGGHYRSVLGTRKLGVINLDPVVMPADESELAAEIAGHVRRDIVEQEEWPTLLGSCLDAIGKGYSVTRVTWDTTNARRWRPLRYEWRDPRWFAYDDATGRELAMLTDDGITRVPLRPGIHLVHEPPLKQGLPVRAGLALPALWYHTVAHTDLIAWVAYVQTFGVPLRIGKYPRNASKKDVAILRRAIINMGRDMGAVMPESMLIEIISGVRPGGSTEHFDRLARMCNDELSKVVLGQTGTTDRVQGALGGQQEQQDVRRDIRSSDGIQTAVAINRLVRWYVSLNWGADAPRPRVRLPVPVPEDVKELAEALDKVVPLGLSVRKKDIYQRFRLSEPEEGDEVLEPREPEQPGAPAPALQRRLKGLIAGLAAAGDGRRRRRDRRDRREPGLGAAAAPPARRHQANHRRREIL